MSGGKVCISSNLKFKLSCMARMVFPSKADFEELSHVIFGAKKLIIKK